MKQISKSGLIILYFCVLSCIFPLFFTNFYYNIQYSKSLFFILTTFLVFFCSLLPYRKRPETGTKDEGRTAGKASDIFRHPCELTVVLFGIWSFISACLSEYGKSAFTGENGRFSGAILIGAMCLCFFLFSRQYVDLEPFSLFFLMGSLTVEVLGILQFVGIDPAGFSLHVPARLTGMYLSTIGQINVFSNYVSIAAAFCIGLYCQTGKKMLLFFSAVSYIALFAGNSDGGFLGLLTAFLLLPLLCPRQANPCPRMLDELMIFSAACAAGCLMARRGIIPYVGLPEFFSRPAFFLPFFLLTVSARFFLMGFFGHKLNVAAFRRCYPILLICLTAAGLLLLLLANLRLISVPALVLDDHWGSDRGFIWRKVLDLYREAPAIRKIFGYGPDTLKLLTVATCYEEMMEIAGKIYDSAHNDFLHYLITTGIVGALLWLSIWVSAAVRSLKAAEARAFPWLLALSAYLIQTMIMPGQPITTPLAFMIAGICIGYTRKQASSSL